MASSTRLVFPLANELETAQVAAMRKLLVRDFDGIACAKWPDVTGDVRLLRFLRGFDSDVDKAVAAVRDMLATRKRYGIDDMHERWAHVECSHEVGFPQQEGINRWKPGIPTAGYGLDGGPVGYEPLRYHQYRAALDEIGEQGLIDFYVAQCESRNMQLHKLSEAQGTMVKMILVIDMRDVSLWQISSRRWARFDEAHYQKINRTLAEILARVYVINCPQWVVSFYRRMEWWVPAATRRKVRLLGADFRKELLQVMDATVMQSMLNSVPGHEEGSPESSNTEATRIDAQLSAGRTFERELIAVPGEAVTWSFEVTSSGDVEFSVVCYPPSVTFAVPSGETEARGGYQRSLESSSNDDAVDDGLQSDRCGATVVVPKRRYSARDGVVAGQHKIPSSVDSDAATLVVVRWSNKFSWMTSKTLRLATGVGNLKPENVEDLTLQKPHDRPSLLDATAIAAHPTEDCSPSVPLDEDADCDINEWRIVM